MSGGFLSGWFLSGWFLSGGVFVLHPKHTYQIGYWVIFHSE